MKLVIAYLIVMLIAIILLGTYVHRNVEDGVKTLKARQAAIADLEKGLHR